LAGELGIDPSEPLRHLHQCVLTQDPALDWNGACPDPAEGLLAGAGTTVAEPIPAHPPATRAMRAPGLGGRRARHLLVIGAALAVAAAVCIIAVARPWAGGATGLPANSVALIGAGGARDGAPVRVGSPGGLAHGDGSVWAVDNTDGTVVRINPATHAIAQTIPVGSAPSAVTATGGDVWVANSGSGTVSEINAVANKVVRKIPVGNVPVAITSGPSGVWVANEGDDTVEQIDPATGAVSRTVPVGGRPDGIGSGPSGVWVANSEDGTVTKIDPATYQPSGPISVGSGPAGIVVTRAAVWVANSFDLTVSKLDPATGRMTGTVDVGDGPTSIVAAKNAIWVSDEFNATLDRIDPQTDQVATIHLASSPRGLAAAGTGVWVAASPFSPARHRGGTLTVVSSYLPERDPATAIDINDAVLGTVYDGLAALRKSGGAAGFSLVPDLATRLPRPADGGTTYTFTLRPGIRYSTGTFVRASDFRRGIARQLSFGANPGYYEGILGAQACHQHPKRCDLSAGIVTSDAARTVTFHLNRPDPDFLYKLALTLAVPAPPGAPNHVINRAPFLPGTGPYKISQYRPAASFTVVRNPYFRQWSYAAQPAGYPDVIRYEQLADLRKQQHLVASGKADLVDLLTDGPLYPSLAVRYPTRIHSGIRAFTQYVVLNTRVPPFTSIKARQAINYAIDRAKIIRLLQLAPGEAAPTCQILPADFPAHHSYCPYTAGSKNGAWHRPDLAKAVQLAKASGTTHVPVTVWSFSDGPDEAASSYLVRLLRQLGYRASVRYTSADQFFTVISNAHRKIQIGWFGIWGPDFPSPSTFFLPLLTCHSFYSDPASTLNWSGFCDPHLDKLARHAQAVQLTDPARARTLWAQVDRMVTDQAPWAPFVNTGPSVFVSARVRNYQQSPVYGPLLDQIWIR
ncbi:MAG: ABC transporter substrate-binding protein, partial [Streptosporangiaceae bacterium]